MIEREAQRLVVKAPMVMANARVEQAGEQVFDLGQVGDADSSALAVMLGWLRAASRSRSTVRFAHIPAGVRSLAELYGLTELLPLA